jgi:hypothetical protein
VARTLGTGISKPGATGASPDRWECERLIRALAFLNNSDFANGERKLRLAEFPSEQCSPRTLQTFQQPIRSRQQPSTAPILSA